jgi:integrase
LAFKAAKIVLRYCYSRKLIACFPFEGYRAALTPDDRARKYLPAAYSAEEVQAMLRQVSPQSKRDWRIHSLLQFQSTQGPRIEQTCSTLWENVFLEPTEKYPWGWVRWPARGTGNKTREHRVQPLLPDGRAALLTAKWWNDQQATPSKWVWPAGRSVYRGDLKGDAPFEKGSFIAALHRLEKKAGIARKGWRASHGLRRHAAIMFYYLSGRSVKAAMDWIGDSIDRADDYLRDEMGGVLDAVADLDVVLQHSAGTKG